MIDTILQGDSLEVLKGLPDGSVNMCVTSPPYYALRDYGVDGQIGLEETPEAYVAKLTALFREVRRVLADDGTLWLNIGDSYAGSGGAGGWNEDRNGAPRHSFRRDRAEVATPKTRGYDGLKAKDLIGIPWMLAFALRADGWYLRQDIIWHKPNPMPESVMDRCTKAHEYLFLLSKSARYYCDMERIAERALQPIGNAIETGQIKARILGQAGGTLGTNQGNESRNRRSVWTIATQPYAGAHFATFPPALIEPCVLAGTAPGGVVLDPFMGSGTTAQVCISLGRHYLGIELNPDYIKLAHKRIRQTPVPLFVEA